MLEPDQNQIYDLSAVAPGVFIRTGVIADGSCFFHAYLRVFRPTYKRANVAERTRIVGQLRRVLASSVSETSLNSELYLLLFITELQKVLAQQDVSTDPHVKVLTKLVNLNTIVDDCSSFTGNLYTEFVDKVNAAGRKAAGDEADLYDEKMNPFVAQWARGIFHQVNQIVIRDFKQRLLTDYVGCTEMEYISRALKCNFLFVKDHQIYPFQVTGYLEWPYLILIWVSEMHFELVGRLDPDRVIQRKFNSQDPLVRAFFPSK